jgi:hypothetical protein
MVRGILSTATLASVVALAFTAPSSAATAPASACAKQSRAVTSAKKAVTKAQKAKATSPKARKQRAKRVKAAKVKHARAKKALATCRAKAKAKPAPAPAPTPEPAPAPPPVLSVVAPAIGPGDSWRVVLAAPAPAAGTHYRVMYMAAPGSRLLSCGFMAVKVAAGPSGETVLQSAKPWCAGPGKITLHVGTDGTPLMPKIGAMIASVDVVVNPA